jgi:hypothetical protein
MGSRLIDKICNSQSVAWATIAASVIIPLSGGLIWEDISRKRSFVETKSIELNESAKIQYTNNNEIEGLKDIQPQINNSVFEYALAYLPEKQQWVQCGLGSETIVRGGDFSSELRLKKWLIKELMGKNSILVLYHTHPTPTKWIYNCITESAEVCSTIATSQTQLDFLLSHVPQEIMESCYANCTKPSNVDVHYMIDLTKQFKKNQEYGDMLFKICSEYGVTQFGLTENGIDWVNNKNKKEVWQWITMNFPSNKEIVFDESINGIQHAQNMISNLNNDIVYVKFKPYEDLFQND